MVAAEVVAAVVVVVAVGAGGALGAMMVGALGMHRLLLAWPLPRALLDLANTRPDIGVLSLRVWQLGHLVSPWSASLRSPRTLVCCSWSTR